MKKIEMLSSLKRDNYKLKCLLSLLGIISISFVIGWGINETTLNSKIVYRIEQLEQYNETTEFFICSDGSYFSLEYDTKYYDSVMINNKVCTKEYGIKTYERWVELDEEDFEEFTNSKYCKSGDRSRECRRSPDCCIASTEGFRYMSNPIETLEAYCVIDHEDKNMYICGEFNVYVDTLKNLNKQNKVWFK